MPSEGQTGLVASVAKGFRKLDDLVCQVPQLGWTK